MNKELINLNLSIKQGDTSKVKKFFEIIFSKENKGNIFPVDLDDVFQIVYERKDHAVRALKADFIEDVDYQIFPKNGDRKTAFKSNETYKLTIKAFEFFIVRKDRQLFNCYSEVMQAMKVLYDSGHLSKLLQNLPSNWIKTFPDSFKSQVMRLYNQPFDPSKNTPQFIGKFINEFVYGAIDKKLPASLKSQRALVKNDNDALEKLHQFLNGDGKDVLKEHLSTTITIMKMSNNIDDFKIKFKHVFYTGNQLELYLRK
jgi:hypothetical protein